MNGELKLRFTLCKSMHFGERKLGFAMLKTWHVCGDCSLTMRNRHVSGKQNLGLPVRGPAHTCKW